MVTMKNAIFLDVESCGSYESRRFGGMSVLKRPTRRHIPEDGILFKANKKDHYVGFHNGDYKECHLLGCGVVWVL
jgi:hypothetical protein